MEIRSIPQSQSSLGFFEIFTESIKTTYRNKELLVPILLLTILSKSYLDFYQDNIQLPFLTKIMWQLSQQPCTLRNLRHKLDIIAYRGALDDILEALFVKQLTLALSSIIWLFNCVVYVSSTYEAYTSKASSHIGMFLRIRKSWKNAFITSFCVLLTYSGVICAYLASYGITNIVVANSCSYLISRAITVLIPICYLYVTSLLMLSMVVSVLEEGFGGFKAIVRATELMNGKSLQASMLIVPFVIAHTYCHYMVYPISNFHMRRSRLLAIVAYWRNGSSCLLSLFMFVDTVFYHEMKKRKP